MGRTHALSGAVTWVAGCATAAAVGYPVQARTVLVGALVTAGAALVPDVDHPSAFLSRCGGPVSRAVARGVAGVCAEVHAATRTGVDRQSRGGHRTLTHTALFAVCAGVGVVAGPVSAVTVADLVLRVADAASGLEARVDRCGARVLVAAALTVLVAVGVRAVTGRARSWPAVVAGLAVGSAALTVPVWWWLGVPVTVGCLAHCAGDALTISGCPVLWPVRVRGRRWYPVGTPRVVRFGTGGPGERMVWWLLLAAGIGSGVLLVT